MDRETITQKQNAAVRLHLLQITIQTYDIIGVLALYQLKNIINHCLTWFFHWPGALVKETLVICGFSKNLIILYEGKLIDPCGLRKVVHKNQFMEKW